MKSVVDLRFAVLSDTVSHLSGFPATGQHLLTYGGGPCVRLVAIKACLSRHLKLELGPIVSSIIKISRETYKMPLPTATWPTRNTDGPLDDLVPVHSDSASLRPSTQQHIDPIRVPSKD